MNGEVKRVFKTRTFGGFDKDDVLNYIEASSQKWKEELGVLKKDIEEKEKEKEGLLSQNTQLLEQVKTLESENGKKDTDIAGLKEELGKASEKIAELQKDLSQYEKMKADIAGIELAARKRAKEIERESLKTINRVKYETEQMLQTAKERFTVFVEGIGEQVNQAESTLDAAKSGFKSLLSGLSGMKDRLRSLETEAEQESKNRFVQETGSSDASRTRETDYESKAEEERNTDELFRSYVDEVTGEAKHLSLKELMDRLKGK